MKLRKKAGIVITEMCKHDRIYWATPPPPPPLKPGAGNEPVPPKIGSPEHKETRTTIPVTAENKQPPEEFHEEQQQRSENRSRANVGEVPPPTRLRPRTIKTPPPVEIYRQQHMNDRLNPPPFINSPMVEPSVREDTDREMQAPPISGAFHMKTPPPLEVFLRQHMDNKPNIATNGQRPEGRQEEIIPIGNVPPKQPDSPKIPPPLRPETEVPLPIGYIPETESETDMPRTPPPLNVWRRMLASMKQTTTLEPPPPDMRSPEFKAGK